MAFKANMILGFICLTLAVINGENFCEIFSKRDPTKERTIDFSFGNEKVLTFGSTSVWLVVIDQNIWTLNVTKTATDPTVVFDPTNSIKTQWFTDIFELAFSGIDSNGIYTIGLKKKNQTVVSIVWARLTNVLKDLETPKLKSLSVYTSDMKVNTPFKAQMASAIDSSYQIIVFIDQYSVGFAPKAYKRVYRFYNFIDDKEPDPTQQSTSPYSDALQVLGLLPEEMELVAMFGPFNGVQEYLFLFSHELTLRYCYFGANLKKECSVDKSTIVLDCDPASTNPTPAPTTPTPTSTPTPTLAPTTPTPTSTPTPTPAPTTPAYDGSTREPASGSLLWIFSLIVFLLIIAAIVGLLVWLFCRQSAPASEATATEPKVIDTVVTKEKAVVKDPDSKPLEAVRSGTG